MNADTWTTKTIETFNSATELAKNNKNATLFPIHVAAALFSDIEGLAALICKKSGGSVKNVQNAIKANMNKLAKQGTCFVTLIVLC